MIESMTSMNKIGELEGPYCFENVTVEEGDVVIDAGAYIGDWAAVAAQMGGEVYAFDPSPDVKDLLYKTASLNNFKVVEYGLGDVVCKKLINTTLPRASHEIDDMIGVPCNLTTLDKFAEENNVHVDFIKSDIEGYECNMLRGASRVLREDCPKLAIRIYHHDGRDAELIPKLVKEINPKYNIIMRRKTMFAYV
jgi:FkbM family methyltransferase